MAYGIAAAAAARGHPIKVLSGPVAMPAPAGVEVIDVRSAREMLDEGKRELASAEHSVLMGVAAVADFRPKQRFAGKPPKEKGAFTLDLVENPDVLAELGALGRARICVGFALESFSEEEREAALERARGKRLRKGLDAIVLNEAAAMEAQGSRLCWLGPDGGAEDLGCGDKEWLAERLVLRVEALMRERGLLE